MVDPVTPVAPVALALAAALIAASLTEWVRRRAVRHGLLDVPNERSSHQSPTPRGGGLAIDVTILAGVTVLGAAGFLSIYETAVLACGGCVLAFLGYMDDVRNLSARTRLLIQSTVSLAVIIALAARPGSLQAFPAMPQALTVALLTLGVIWGINLFNFMDGIDGLAASQALFMAGASALFIWLSGGSAGMALVYALTSGACLGFLFLNWSPASIFMGDVGSAFLGYWLTALAIAAHLAGDLSIWVSAALGTIFVADATTTLLRRVIQGKSWRAAHRTHLYQRLSTHLAHRRTTVLLGLVNLIVVWPAAYLAQLYPQWAPWTTSGLLAVAILVCWQGGAGLEVTRATGRATPDGNTSVRDRSTMNPP